MNTFLICRLCLIKQDPAQCKQILPQDIYNNVLVSSMFKLCIPELDMNVYSHLWVCRECLQALANFYKFKTMCLKNIPITNCIVDSNNICNPLPPKKCDISLTSNKVISNRSTNIDIKENASSETLSTLVNKDSIKRKKFSFYRKKFTDWSCTGCKNRLLDARYHSKVHSEYFDCFHCGKRFTLIAEIRKHIYNHTLSYKCNICDKNWKGKYDLEIHMRSHTKQKPFECPECHKKFAQSYCLHQHLRIHQRQDEDNFNKCSVCGKTLSTKYNLKIHMTTHNLNSKPRCPKCNKWFYTEAAVMKHLGTCASIIIKKEESQIMETNPLEFIKTEVPDSIKQELEDDDIFIESYQPSL